MINWKDTDNKTFLLNLFEKIVEYRMEVIKSNDDRSEYGMWFYNISHNISTRINKNHKYVLAAMYHLSEKGYIEFYKRAVGGRGIKKETAVRITKFGWDRWNRLKITQ